MESLTIDKIYNTIESVQKGLKDTESGAFKLEIV
jgi:hypothetical protein